MNGTTMSNDNVKQLRARLRREAQAINERNRVPGDLYYKEPAPPPEQPARKDEGEWHVEQDPIHGCSVVTKGRIVAAGIYRRDRKAGVE